MANGTSKMLINRVRPRNLLRPITQAAHKPNTVFIGTTIRAISRVSCAAYKKSGEVKLLKNGSNPFLKAW